MKVLEAACIIPSEVINGGIHFPPFPLHIYTANSSQYVLGLGQQCHLYHQQNF